MAHFYIFCSKTVRYVENAAYRSPYLKDHQKKNYCIALIAIFHTQSLLYKLSKHIKIIRLKCEVGCKKIQLNSLSRKNEITLRTTQ